MDKKYMVYVHNGIYSAINKRDILTFDTTLMDLEHIMLNKSKKDKYYMISL